MTRTRKKLPTKRRKLPVSLEDQFKPFKCPKHKKHTITWLSWCPKCLDIPPFLDRRKWTKEQHDQHKQRCLNLEREMYAKGVIKPPEKTRSLAESNKRIYARAARARQSKKLRQGLREANKLEKLERKAKKLVKERNHDEHDGIIIGALRQGDETSSQVNKRTGLTTREIRHSLKRLIKKRRVTKLSSKRYELVPQRTRRRLSDVK